MRKEGKSKALGLCEEIRRARVEITKRRKAVSETKLMSKTASRQSRWWQVSNLAARRLVSSSRQSKTDAKRGDRVRPAPVIAQCQPCVTVL